MVKETYLATQHNKAHLGFEDNRPTERNYSHHRRALPAYDYVRNAKGYFCSISADEANDISDKEHNTITVVLKDVTLGLYSQPSPRKLSSSVWTSERCTTNHRIVLRI